MSRIMDQAADLSLEQKRALLARLLREKGGAARSEDGFVHRLIEAQAAQTPEAIAVRCGTEELTYRELDTRANQLARSLQGLGAGPESLVGVCAERSVAMMVGLLGISKAGAAYVPLDPAYPADRLAYMLGDARVAVLLTENRLRDTVSSPGTPVVCLDTEWPAISRLDARAPRVEVRGDHLAYVIYTSGSTGRPKGVQVPHRALANFLRSMRQLLGMANHDVLLSVTTLSFDIAALELFLPLTLGARVTLASREDASDGPRLAELLERSGATFLQATPATWRLLLESGWPGSPALMMLCGGESLPRELASRLIGRGRSLWNLYGPTETTIWSSAAQVEPGDGPVPIGRPIAKTQLYVLDARLRPVPVGVTGELYIGGEGLARGYLNRPGLTAERFIADPVGREPGGRLYRTGDLARWRSDGGLECLGRVDQQVKIRGFRVELGEVEAAILAQPAVREAVVVARVDGSGEQSLAAYVVPRESPALSVAELRTVLRQSLPDFMVPSAFVTLDELPKTPNGKIDRNALPEPGQVGPGAEVYVPPRGPIEEALTEIWSDIVGRERVGVYDNFFEIGGHSLFVTRLFARLRDLFGVEALPLHEFFETPTVAWLAARIEASMRLESGLASPPIVPVSRDRPLPASFAQQRLWFLDQLDPGTASYNIPTAVRLTGHLDVSALERALNEVVCRHEVLRTTFKARDGQPWQVIAPTSAVPLPATDLSSIAESHRDYEVARLLDAEAKRPFDLERGPLIRAGLLRLAEDEHVVFVTLHHIAADGWSIGILIRELGALYEAFRRELPSPLPSLSLQYADYAVWQREWLRDDVLRTQLDYWRRELAGVRVLELPTDRPRLAGTSHKSGVRAIALPNEILDALKAVGRQDGATLFMTLLAGFQTLLHRYTGQQDISVGTPIAGRTRSEIENLVGLFVNTLVLRGDLSGDPSFRELLRRVRRTALAAYAHQDLPFDQLVGTLQPERDPSRTPLFQVMFAMQDVPLPSVSTPELTMAPLPTGSGAAKFELTLFADARDGQLRLTMEYNSDLFEEATIDRMLRHLRTLLEGIAANPDQSVATLPMLTEEEQRQLTGQWGDDADQDMDGLDDLSDEELDSMIQSLSSEEETRS